MKKTSATTITNDRGDELVLKRRSSSKMQTPKKSIKEFVSRMDEDSARRVMTLA
jgi:hypothetical protein